MNEAPGATEVLRGMGLEAAPVRLRGREPPGVPLDSAVATPAGAASQDALQALEQLRAQATEAGHAEGLRRGYEEGLQQGRQQGQAESAERLQRAIEDATLAAQAPLREEQERLRALALGLARLPEECLAACEDEMVALCFEALCRMLGEQGLAPAAVRSQVRHLLAQARPGDQVALHMHPQDVELLRACLGEAGPALVADAEVRCGGAIVRASGASLDARLETMLDACKATLLAARATRTGGAEDPA